MVLVSSSLIVVNNFGVVIARIKKVMSLNGYLRCIRNKIIKHLENRKNTENTDTLKQENIATTFWRIPYAGVEREKLLEKIFTTQ